MTSPTQRSMKAMRDLGFVAVVVERWNPDARVRNDLFGMFDILAMRQGSIVGVQTTSGANFSSRIHKIRENPLHLVWLSFGKIEVHGWEKKGPRGKRKVWEVRVHRFV